MKNLFPQRLSELLKVHNISKRKLARAIGVSAASICDWSKGKVQPTADSIIAVAKYFNESADYLLGLED